MIESIATMVLLIGIGVVITIATLMCVLMLSYKE
jgi:hypothetical protein